jgi:uncharacterized protein YjiS (DUF1127 family)
MEAANCRSVERPCIVTIVEFIVVAMQDAAAIARRARVRHRQCRRTMAIYEVLRRLDDRTLRDIGFDRSEILPIAAELAGEAERNRVHVRKSINEVQYEQQ